MALCALLTAVIIMENAYVADMWAQWVSTVVLVAACVVLVLAIIFCAKEIEALFKLAFIVLVVGVIVFSVFSVLNATKIMQKMMVDGALTVEGIKNYILSLGDVGLIVFMCLQIAQVTLIPIPSNIVTMAGVGIFGVWPAFIYSTIGQIIGSIIAYALGKVFGPKLVAWIIGKDALNKYQGMIKGRDKLLLTVMFVLPVFPDDILCLIAGLSSMGWLYFIIVMFIARPLTCLGNAFLADGALNIPFEGWGIVAWVAIVLAFGALMFAIFKYGDKFQDFVVSKFKRNKSGE